MADIGKTLLGVVVLTPLTEEDDKYVLTASPQTANLQQSEVRVECQTTGTGAFTIQLPKISTFEGKYQALKVIFIDSGAQASTTNILIFPDPDGDTLQGGIENITINTNEGASVLCVGDRNTWVIQ